MYMLLVTVNEIKKEISDLYQMQKVRNIKPENDDDDDDYGSGGGGGEVTLINMEKNFKRTCCTWKERA